KLSGRIISCLRPGDSIRRCCCCPPRDFCCISCVLRCAPLQQKELRAGLRQRGIALLKFSLPRAYHTPTSQKRAPSTPEIQNRDFRGASSLGTPLRAWAKENPVPTGLVRRSNCCLFIPEAPAEQIPRVLFARRKKRGLRTDRSG